MSTGTMAENRISGNGALAPVQKLITHDDSPIAYIMDTARFEHSQRIAKMMSVAAFMPKHLVDGTPERATANCMMVLSQSLRWQFDPFLVAPETYEVKGKLSYQGKLVAAVVNARGKLKQPLDTVYSTGKGDDLAAVIYGSRQEIPKEAKEHLKKYAQTEDHDALFELKFMGIMAIRVTVGQCKTDKPMWKTDPTQKLFYTGATKWARRFCPELMFGVITDEDMERTAYAGPVDVPAGTSPRTLEDLNKAMEGAATITLPESTEITPKKPEPEVKQVEAVESPNPELPAWAQTIINRIDAANKTSLLEPIGDELIADMRNPSTPEPDKLENYPILFTEWACAMRKIAKASDKPRINAKVGAWESFLPADLHVSVMNLIA